MQDSTVLVPPSTCLVYWWDQWCLEPWLTGAFGCLPAGRLSTSTKRAATDSFTQKCSTVNIAWTGYGLSKESLPYSACMNQTGHLSRGCRCVFVLKVRSASHPAVVHRSADCVWSGRRLCTQLHCICDPPLCSRHHHIWSHHQRLCTWYLRFRRERNWCFVLWLHALSEQNAVYHAKY